MIRGLFGLAALAVVFVLLAMLQSARTPYVAPVERVGVYSSPVPWVQPVAIEIEVPQSRATSYWNFLTWPLYSGSELGVSESFRSRILRGLSTPIVLLAIFTALIVMTSGRNRRRKRMERAEAAHEAAEEHQVDPVELQKRRREAAVISRMYNVMDRIETRVERLESALLP